MILFPNRSNTNGLRIAQDQDFCDRLAQYKPGLEIYLQFDSFEAATLEELRGQDLRAIRKQAIAHLNERNLSTTLVATLKKGLNDHEIGKIIDYALQQRCVRGVTFQPIYVAGRLEGFDAKRDRYTLTEVRRAILEQSPHFQPQDILPVPCHPDSLAMAYALKAKGQVIRLQRRGKHGMVKGAIAMATLTALLNGTCFVFVFSG